MESIDVVVIGAGLVGAAIARELVASNYQVAILERAGGPAEGVSCTNAGILASGFDRPAASLEARLIRDGAALWPQLFASLGIPVRHTGALVLASKVQDVGRFSEILGNARALGIQIEPVDSKRLRDLEPAVNARAALHILEEAVTDPVEVTRRLLSTVPVHYNAAVLAVDQRVRESALVRTAHAAIAARVVINAAGLFADEVAADGSFSITPRRGDFVVYAPTDPPLLQSILRPIEREAGVLVFPTIYGYVCAGPSSVDQTDKNDWRPPGPAGCTRSRRATLTGPFGDATGRCVGRFTSGRKAAQLLHRMVATRSVHAQRRRNPRKRTLGVLGHRRLRPEIIRRAGSRTTRKTTCGNGPNI